MKTSSCLLGLSFPCLLLLVIFPCATSLSFNYNFSGADAGVLTDAGILKYMEDSAAATDRIELTNTSRSWSTGRVAHMQPVRLWEDKKYVASFTSSFTFAIVESSDGRPRGDGMAFFVAPYTTSPREMPVEMPQDARGGFLALFNNPNNSANTLPRTVAVELDTNRNDGWDPPSPIIDHIGIDVNDIRSIKYENLTSGSLNGIMSALVRYDAKAATLSATLWFVDPPRQGPVTVSANVDLREAGLPQDAAVGFSAATGNSSELHQILAWSFESTMTDTTTKNIGLVAGLVSGGVFILLAIAAWVGYLQYHKRKGMQLEDAEIHLDQDMDEEFEMCGPRKFSYTELSQATQGFSEKEKLGGGGFGAVYRGFLQEQVLHVAIKKVSETSRQGRREYIAEVTIIGRLRHRNLVNLVGWCHKSDEFLLVYELMENRSLDVHLYNSKQVLAWPTRYKIILGMGSALFYLHQECEQCVLHRDIKPSNVMLDSSFNAKLGDFGLARLVDHSRGGFTTAQVAGTRGYMDPEYVYSGRATTESDVYSFGVVLLEIACGRRPVIEHRDESKVVLVDWVWALHGRKMLLDAVDARLDGGFDAQEMERVLVVGLWCVHPDYGFRPSIRQALNVLRCEAQLPDLPPEMPVATYARPHAVHGWSSYMSSSTGAGSSATTGGRSSKSDQMIGSAKSHSFATAADTGGATRPSAAAADQNDATSSTGEHSGNG